MRENLKQYVTILRMGFDLLIKVYKCPYKTLYGNSIIIVRDHHISPLKYHNIIQENNYIKRKKATIIVVGIFNGKTIRL